MFSVAVLIFSSECMYIFQILFERLDACEINWKKKNFLNVKSDVFSGSQSHLLPFYAKILGRWWETTNGILSVCDCTLSS